MRFQSHQLLPGTDVFFPEYLVSLPAGKALLGCLLSQWCQVSCPSLELAPLDSQTVPCSLSLFELAPLDSQTAVLWQKGIIVVVTIDPEEVCVCRYAGGTCSAAGVVL